MYLGQFAFEPYKMGFLNFVQAAMRRCVDFGAAEQLARELNVSLFEVSAKTGINVDEAFAELARDMRDRLALWRLGAGAAPPDLDDPQDRDGDEDHLCAFHVDGIARKPVRARSACCAAPPDRVFI